MRLVLSPLRISIGVAVVCSVIASLIGRWKLPTGAVVMRNSLGATWPRSVALVGFPALVIGLAAVAAVTSGLRIRGAAAGLAVAAIVTVIWQIAAFLHAGA